MLKTSIESEEDYNTFLRPAIMDSIREVLSFYRLQSTAEIYYNGENEIAKQVGSDATDPRFANHYTDGIFRSKIFISTEVEPHEFNSGDNNKRDMPTELSLWSDDGVLPLILTPSFEGRLITVNVTAFFNSRTAAKQFRNRISRLQANQVAAFNFSPTVHMVINPEIIEFMREVHGLLVKNDPSTKDLSSWFYDQCRFPVTEVTNVKGNHGRMVAPRQFNDIGIYFNEPQTALSKKVEQFGKYEVTLGYRFFFQEFIGWELEYPLNVYQDEISTKWIPRRQKQFNKQFTRKVAPEIAFGLSLTSPDRQIQTPFYFKLPDYDPWTWPVAPWQQPIIQGRCKMDDSLEPIVGGPIFELPGYKWNEHVKRYMIRRRDYIHTHLETPFLVKVYCGHLPVRPEFLFMDETGTTRMRGQAHLKETYRIVIVLDWAIRDYSDSFWDDLKNHMEDAVLVESIFPSYDWNQFPSHWLNHLDKVRQDIAKGWGKPGGWFNNYMMNLGLTAFTLLEEKP